jgi:hypothetical protein
MRHRLRCQKIIMDLKETVGECTGLNWLRITYTGRVVNVVMNHWIPQKVGYFLTSCISISFANIPLNGHMIMEIKLYLHFRSITPQNFISYNVICVSLIFTCKTIQY